LSGWTHAVCQTRYGFGKPIFMRKFTFTIKEFNYIKKKKLLY